MLPMVWHTDWLCCMVDSLVLQIVSLRMVIKTRVKVLSIRPMKLDYQFLAQIFENLMRAGGYYSLFSKRHNTHPKHEDFCQKSESTLITPALNS